MISFFSLSRFRSRSSPQWILLLLLLMPLRERKAKRRRSSQPFYRCYYQRNWREKNNRIGIQEGQELFEFPSPFILTRRKTKATPGKGKSRLHGWINEDLLRRSCRHQRRTTRNDMFASMRQFFSIIFISTVVIYADGWNCSVSRENSIILLLLLLLFLRRLLLLVFE